MAKSSTVLLDGIVKTESTRPGFSVTSFSLSGERHANLIVSAVKDAYPKVWGGADIDFDALVGKKVTFLRASDGAFGASSITAEEATIFKTARGTFAFLPKGKRTKGYGLRTENVLDVIDGYGGTAELAKRVATVRDRFPVLTELTKDDLEALPSRSNTCTLAVLGTLTLDNTTHEALWLIHSYIRDGDIVEGVLLLPRSVGDSEHGSVYGTDLLKRGGKVVGFTPISLKDALALTGKDSSEVIAELAASIREA